VILTSTKVSFLRFRNPLKSAGRCRDTEVSSRHCKYGPLSALKSCGGILYGSPLYLYMPDDIALDNDNLNPPFKSIMSSFVFDAIAKLIHLST
jgi:hypothetical protein